MQETVEAAAIQDGIRGDTCHEINPLLFDFYNRFLLSKYCCKKMVNIQTSKGPIETLILQGAFFDWSRSEKF